jgi:hypothetical protein
MSGCRPEYFPVVVAIIEAMLDERFKLHTANSSTGSAPIAFVVNGPIIQALGMNFRGNVLGPGCRANATIGRAVRLVQINAFGSRGGAGNEGFGEEDRGSDILDRSTFGTPAKYVCYHFVENEVDFPWLEPMHVERGFAPETSTVTVFTAGGHMHLSMNAERTCSEWVSHFARYVVGMGRLNVVGEGECLVGIPPETALLMQREGWSKGDLKSALYQATLRSMKWIKEHGWRPGGMGFSRPGPTELGDESLMLGMAGSPEGINVVVCGGTGSAFGWYQYPYAYTFTPVTKVIRSGEGRS